MISLCLIAGLLGANYQQLASRLGLAQLVNRDLGAPAVPAQTRSLEALHANYKALTTEQATNTVFYSLLADLNRDQEPEYAVVMGERTAFGLWFVTPDKRIEAPGNADFARMTLRSAFLLDQGGEKHLVVLAGYPPQNTKVRVYRLRDSTPEVLFDFMADWDVRVSADGITAVWKRYKPEGGFDLVADTYHWSAQAGSYTKRQ